MLRHLSAAALCVLCVSAAAADDQWARSVYLLSELDGVRPINVELLHSSLDGFPPVPEPGVTIKVTCLITQDGLRDCKESGDSDEQAKLFIPVALTRAAAIGVSGKDKTGQLIVGKRVALDVHIRPSDRFDGASVDFSRGAQLIFTANPLGSDLSRYYPIHALEKNVQAVVDIVCVVKEDLSADCPDIRVDAGKDATDEMVEDFTQAARRIAKIFRIAPQTKDGQSAIGLGFRKRISFRLA